ncbi:MAG: lytic transglycosylase domain-containing protein [Alphaproteobacteria bacterium]
MRNHLANFFAASLIAALASFGPGAPAAAKDPVTHVTLPAPLGEADVARYRRIFELQHDGRWKQADREIAQLEDRLLLGHVDAQRYLHPRKYRSRFRELAAWMRDYADHPEAKRIYKLAIRRKPRRARAPRPPARLGSATYADDGGQDVVRRRFSRRARSVLYRVRGMVRRERLTAAEKYLDRARTKYGLRRDETAAALGHIAAGWFYYGKDEKALKLAGRAAALSRANAPTAHWYGGLAAYRSGQFAAAVEHFEAMAGTRGLASWSRAAGAFWAARANMAARRPARVSPLLRIAADEQRTFYGILARRLLGIDSPFNWDRPILSTDDAKSVMTDARARRALALIQVDQPVRAEAELRLMSRTGDPATRTALLAIADRLGLSSLAFRTATRLADSGGRVVERGLYPVPRWRPRDGFTIDRALIFAVMRQESAFNTRAHSRAGARGLMQLMPGTASYIAKKRFRGRGRQRLYDPVLNVTLGQKYLRYLLAHDTVQGNMFHLAAAYNGGPGNLAKWRRRVGRLSRDPLLFIESLPSRETRNFIERVLANLWLYRERFNQAAPSLDALAAGRAPFYKSLDRAQVAKTTRNARN